MPAGDALRSAGSRSPVALLPRQSSANAESEFLRFYAVATRRRRSGYVTLRPRGMEVQFMFLDYYQLQEQPFGALASPSQLYASQTYCEALESLSETILGDRGNLVLLGESGMGKTTLLFQVVEGLRETGRAAFLFQKHCTSRDILQFLLSGMGVDSTSMDLSLMRNKLNQVWFAEMLAGRRFVLIFDDAQSLDEEALETLQFISKFETPNTKLLQLLLCGQPIFLEKLQQHNLEQFRKRIMHFKALENFTPMETVGYIRHRLKIAGYHGDPIFDPEALALIADRSQGIPRNINKICSRAMLEAYARGLRSASAEIVEKAERNLHALSESGIAGIEAAVGELAEEHERRAAPHMAHQAPTKLGLPRSGAWAVAIVAVLLTAGLGLPHGMLKGMTQMMRGESTATVSTIDAQRQPARQSLSNSVTAATPANLPPASPAVPAKRTLDTDVTVNQNGQLSLTRELGLKINRIVIDPGHGGFDTGAKGPHGLLEKDLCLDVALRLGQMIEENIPGAEVVYTRKDDSYVPLGERTNIANSAAADLFISIHANSSDASEVRGVETYYLSLATSKEAKELAIRENSLTQSSLHDLPDLVQKITRSEEKAESKHLAEEIQGMLSERLQLVSSHEKNRGVKQAPFIVLTGANMPAVLSEISFVSNASDESLLLEGGQRQRIAEGLFRGIAGYLDGLHGQPQIHQKLVTENRANSVAGLDRSLVETGRNPLQQAEKLR
jgi:N-acetylmuramoyl-L-alanine amidase